MGLHRFSEFHLVLLTFVFLFFVFHYALFLNSKIHFINTTTTTKTPPPPTNQPTNTNINWETINQT